METNGELREQQRQADRAEAAPWVDFPPTPAWYFPAAGVWFAALTVCAAGVADTPLQSLFGFLVLIALEIAFFAWYRSYRGTLPRLGRGAPPELQSTMRWYFAGVAAVVVVVAAVVLLVGSYVGAGVAFVLVTVGLVVYERAYIDAARRIRERLA